MATKQATNKKKLLAVLEKSPIVEFACKKVGVSRATFYRWKKEDSDFADEVDRATDQGVDQVNDLAEAKLISKINEGHVTAIIFWLKYRHPAFKKVFLQKSNIKEKSEFMWPISQEMIDEADKVLAENNQEIITINKSTGERLE